MNLTITKYLGLALLVAGVGAAGLAMLGKDAQKAWEAFGLVAAGLIGVVRQDHSQTANDVAQMTGDIGEPVPPKATTRSVEQDIIVTPTSDEENP